MCGIAGLLDPARAGSAEELAAEAARMAGTVAHRGPDDEGTWVDPAAGVALGHRRLAIIDTSAAGHQPMVSADGRWVITYNGECYNSPELRGQLPAGLKLKGHCDTELVVEAIAAWGLRPALDRIDGMFAFAAWDRQDRTLYLVRDRLGEKPMYYSVAGGAVRFGSELRALGADRHIDHDAAGLLLQLSYIPAPATILTGARKLAAGTMVSFGPGDTGWPEPVTWWDFRTHAQSAMDRRPAHGDGSVEHLEAVLLDSVRRRLVADVPVGCFLSGGIDSSLVAALAQAAGESVRTFTVGFGGAEGDEAAYGAAVARHLQTDHTQIDLTAADALAVVPSLGSVWDEPFADPSQIPTLLLCREARRQVTVALSGDGGDEVFGGYRRYTAGGLLARWMLPAPVGVRSALARAVPVSLARRAGEAWGSQAAKFEALLPARSEQDVFVSLVSSWPGRWTPPDLGWSGSFVDRMMAWDTLSTLPDEMLVKVDRASMSAGLEVRVPLLAPAVLDAAWSLPPSLRIRGGRGKQALRAVLHRYVPPALVERPKAGFDPPLGPWLRGPLREWASDLISTAGGRGLVDGAAVRRRWQALLAGEPGHDYAVWAVLMLESWLAVS